MSGQRYKKSTTRMMQIEPRIASQRLRAYACIRMVRSLVQAVLPDFVPADAGHCCAGLC